MRIAINALSARAGGGITAFRNLLPALARVDGENEYVVFVSSRQQEILEAVPERFKIVIPKGLPENPYLRVFWEQFFFPIYLFKLGIDILYSVGNLTTLLAPCRIVLLVENANPYSPLHLPLRLRDRLRNGLLRALCQLSVMRATRIRFVSRKSRDVLGRRMRLPKGKAVTIYHGFQPLPDPPGTGALEGRYILTISVVLPHKNLERLVRAYTAFVRDTGYDGKLIVVGDLIQTGYVEKLKLLAKGLGMDGNVYFTGRVPFIGIKSYYLGADAFVFPSLEETFGLPVIEAMGYGVPVAVSDESQMKNGQELCIPFREICGDAAHYFDPFDPEDMAVGLRKVIFDLEYREELIYRARKQVLKYNWDETARELVILFEDANRCEKESVHSAARRN